jgi:hypothetical protein
MPCRDERRIDLLVNDRIKRVILTDYPNDPFGAFGVLAVLPRFRPAANRRSC